MRPGSEIVTIPSPNFISLPADQGLHRDTMLDGWYAVSHLRCGKREFGFRVTFLGGKAAPEGGFIAQVAVLDRQTGKVYSEIRTYSQAEVSVSSETLDIRTPSASLRGPLNQLVVRTSIPGVEVDLVLSGKVLLYACGTGFWPFAGATTYQFSAPCLRTSGTVTLNGIQHRVQGGSWYDRQWYASSAPPPGFVFHWMGLSLDNGHGISLWDNSAGGDHSPWATLVEPNGTHIITSVTPLSESAAEFRRHEGMRREYPTRWRVAMPALNTELDVSQFPLDEWEMGACTVYTGILSVKGIYKGQSVSGYGFTDIGSRNTGS
jgi:predicted secreted hydrolase